MPRPQCCIMFIFVEGVDCSCLLFSSLLVDALIISRLGHFHVESS